MSVFVVKQGSLAMSEKVTGKMRWYRGHVLQQQWSITVYEDSKISEQRLEWRDVPQAEDE